MSYELLEKKMSNLSESQKQSVLDYINFLIYQNTLTNRLTSNTKRQPGGLNELVIADDFDEPLDCFKEYI